MKKSWQQALEDDVNYWKSQYQYKSIEYEKLKAEVEVLRQIAKGPATVTIACEKVVDCAAHMVTDVLQLLKEVKK